MKENADNEREIRQREYEDAQDEAWRLRQHDGTYAVYPEGSDWDVYELQSGRVSTSDRGKPRGGATRPIAF